MNKPSFCIWCNEGDQLVNGKKYCQNCQMSMYKECCRCHRPFPSEKYFTSHSDRCNSCQKKYLCEKNSRRKRKEKLVYANTDDEVENAKPTPGVNNVEDSKTDEESLLSSEKPTTSKKSRKRTHSGCQDKPQKKKVFAAYLVIEQDKLGLFPKF